MDGAFRPLGMHRPACCKTCEYAATGDLDCDVRHYCLSASCPAPLDDVERVVFTCLFEHGAARRSEIQSATGLAWSTLFDVLHHLEQRALVKRSHVKRCGRGRPHTVWEVV
jgi:DNA-binding MarR family transcriptional regulator